MQSGSMRQPPHRLVGPVVFPGLCVDAGARAEACICGGRPMIHAHHEPQGSCGGWGVCLFQGYPEGLPGNAFLTCHMLCLGNLRLGKRVSPLGTVSFLYFLFIFF